MDANPPDVSLDWLLDKQIAHFTLRSSNRQAIDTWIDLLIATLKEWPDDKPCFILHNASASTIAFTPYARSRSQELMKLRPDLHSWIALILSRTLAGQLIQVFLMILSRGLPRSNIAVFFSETDGLEWLKREMAKKQRPITSETQLNDK